MVAAACCLAGRAGCHNLKSTCTSSICWVEAACGQAGFGIHSLETEELALRRLTRAGLRDVHRPTRATAIWNASQDLPRECYSPEASLKCSFASCALAPDPGLQNTFCGSLHCPRGRGSCWMGGFVNRRTRPILLHTAENLTEFPSSVKPLTHTRAFHIKKVLSPQTSFMILATGRLLCRKPPPHTSCKKQKLSLGTLGPASSKYTWCLSSFPPLKSMPTKSLLLWRVSPSLCPRTLLT